MTTAMACDVCRRTAGTYTVLPRCRECQGDICLDCAAVGTVEDREDGNRPTLWCVACAAQQALRNGHDGDFTNLLRWTAAVIRSSRSWTLDPSEEAVMRLYERGGAQALLAVMAEALS